MRTRPLLAGLLMSLWCGGGGAMAADAACSHSVRRSRGARVDQTLCTDANTAVARFAVHVRLPRRSFAQRITLAVQHRAAGAWVTDQTSGLAYETPVSSDGRHTRHQLERVSASRISIAIDQPRANARVAQGTPVRVLATATTTGPGRTVRSVYWVRLTALSAAPAQTAPG